MIPKQLRLKTNRVKYVLLKGRKSGNNCLSLKFLPTSNSTSRFTVVISNKIEPLAVKRNYLKRQIYEIIRLNQTIFKKSFDTIIFVKQDLKKLKYSNLKDELLNHFKKIHLT